jgi:hypothetical protein
MRSLFVAYGAVAVFVLLLPLAGARAKAQEPPVDQRGRNQQPDPADKSQEEIAAQLRAHAETAEAFRHFPLERQPVRPQVWESQSFRLAVGFGLFGALVLACIFCAAVGAFVLSRVFPFMDHVLNIILGFRKPS